MKETRQGYLPLTPLAYLIFVNVGTPKKCTGLKKSTPPPMVTNISYAHYNLPAIELIYLSLLFVFLPYMMITPLNNVFRHTNQIYCEIKSL